LNDLDRRIGTVMGAADWRAFGVTLVGGLAASGAGVGAVHVAADLHPFPLALVVCVIFGGVYFGVTKLLRHPDATRIWTFLH
jgi:hypothetical protein